MKIYTEQSLINFQFWCGAKDNAAMLTYEELEQLDYIFEDLFPEGAEDTQINDAFWFDFEWVVECLGYRLDSDKWEIIREETEDNEE